MTAMLGEAFGGFKKPAPCSSGATTDLVALTYQGHGDGRLSVRANGGNQSQLPT